MNYFTFGAIVLGSKDVSLKIYQISPKIGIKQLDYVNYPIEIGREAYIEKRISPNQIEEICEILEKFRIKLKEYHTNQTQCYATSAIREAQNREMIVNQIKIRTGFSIQILSNSELRLLMYKGMSISYLDFRQIIQKNTAVLDVGAGSVQVSLFDKGELYTTQNIPIRTINLQNLLSGIEGRNLDYASIVEEYVTYELDVFQTIYLKDKAIKNVIIIGQDNAVWNKIAKGFEVGEQITQEQLEHLYKSIRKATTGQIASEYEIPYERARFILPSIIIYKTFLEKAKADSIWISQTNLCDGAVVDYAERTKKVTPIHDFNADIIAAARNLAKRYRCNKMHTQLAEELSLGIFDKMKKYHGLGERDRILLQIGCILHDCGKFINMNEAGLNGYHLIGSTEIIGLSHRERNLVSYIIRYTNEPFPRPETLAIEDYLIIVKLSVILRIAHTLDRGNKKKFANYHMIKKKHQLIITVVTDQDITLEKVLFNTVADDFKEVYGVAPIILQRSEQIYGL